MISLLLLLLLLGWLRRYWGWVVVVTVVRNRVDSCWLVRCLELFAASEVMVRRAVSNRSSSRVRVVVLAVHLCVSCRVCGCG